MPVNDTTEKRFESDIEAFFLSAAGGYAKCIEMDTLIAKKTALLEEMESYKKSVIYEYVTGKKEVTV